MPTGYGACMGRKVLVVTMVEHAEPELRRLLGDDVDELEVVVPVVKQSFLDWLANDERARSAPRRRPSGLPPALPGETVAAEAGESDPALAVQDALAVFPADEIVPSCARRTNRPGSRTTRSSRAEPFTACRSAACASPRHNAPRGT